MNWKIIAVIATMMTNIGNTVSDGALIARVAQAEAGNQSDAGVALVADTVLNRVDSDRFPNTVKGVIYQKYQFQTVTNGSINCIPEQRIYKIVAEEMKHRRNSDVLFFTAGSYNEHCIPLFKEGDHYFGR